jgi:hypothetical protein
MPISNTLLGFGIVIILLLCVIIYSNSKSGFVGRRNYNYYSYPIFNLGTRAWFPTHLQSYDVRGDIPVAYYPPGAFNQPEMPSRGLYPVIEPNFYTYEYVNPMQGLYPPAWNSNYSVPFKMDNNNSIASGGVKPITNSP